MKLIKSRGRLLPIRKDTGAIERSSTLQFFIPCDGLSNGYLIETKQGCVIQPQAGASFEYDSTLKAVRSTALGPASASALISGTFPEMATGKKALFMAAGYLRIPDGAPAKTIRVALGDINNPGNSGWGMSDGQAGGTVGHTLFGIQGGDTNGSYYDDGTFPPNPQDPLGQEIENVVGANGYFYRYAIYDPAVAIQVSEVRRGDTGAVIIANTEQYGSTDNIGAVTISPYFRTHGIFLTGVGLWYFDTIPADYLLGILSMANYWKDGDRVVWPW